MRVKVRFNAEAGQSPIVLDVRFLPRIGERLELGFRRIIEVLEVHRLYNDNRYGGIVRAKYIHIERTPSPPLPRPLPMAPLPMAPVELPPSAPLEPVSSQRVPVNHLGNLGFEELSTSLEPQIDPLGHL